jgi:hypothetical protein
MLGTNRFKLFKMINSFFRFAHRSKNRAITAPQLKTTPTIQHGTPS